MIFKYSAFHGKKQKETATAVSAIIYSSYTLNLLQEVAE